MSGSLLYHRKFPSTSGLNVSKAIALKDLQAIEPAAGSLKLTIYTLVSHALVGAAETLFGDRLRLRMPCRGFATRRSVPHFRLQGRD